MHVRARIRRAPSRLPVLMAISWVVRSSGKRKGEVRSMEKCAQFSASVVSFATVAVLWQGCALLCGATTGVMVQTVQPFPQVQSLDKVDYARRGSTTGAWSSQCWKLMRFRSCSSSTRGSSSSWTRLLTCPLCATSGVMVQTMPKTVWRGFTAVKMQRQVQLFSRREQWKGLRFSHRQGVLDLK